MSPKELSVAILGAGIWAKEGMYSPGIPCLACVHKLPIVPDPDQNPL